MNAASHTSQVLLPAHGEKVRAARMRGFLATLAISLITPAVFACPVCFGNANGPQQDGVNNAIFFMLAIVGVVQLGFVALFIAFWRRARELRKHREEWRLIKGGVS